MTREPAQDARRTVYGYAAFYAGLAFTQLLGTLGLVPVSVAGLLAAPVPIAGAVARGRPLREWAALLAATALAGGLGSRALSGAAILLVAGSLGLPIGRGVRRNGSYGRSVAVVTLLMFAALAGTMVGAWSELGEAVAQSRDELGRALDEAGGDERAIRLLERQVWVTDHWPYLLFGVAFAIALFAGCAMVSAARQWIARRHGLAGAGSFRTMRPPDALAWLVILMFALWYADYRSPSETLRYVAWNGAIALAVVYWVNGLCVLAFTLRALRPHPLIGMMLIAISLLLLNLLTVVGLFDTWGDFRPRIARRLAGERPRGDGSDDVV